MADLKVREIYRSVLSPVAIYTVYCQNAGGPKGVVAVLSVFIQNKKYFVVFANSIPYSIIYSAF